MNRAARQHATGPEQAHASPARRQLLASGLPADHRGRAAQPPAAWPTTGPACALPRLPRQLPATGASPAAHGAAGAGSGVRAIGGTGRGALIWPAAGCCLARAVLKAWRPAAPSSQDTARARQVKCCAHDPAGTAGRTCGTPDTAPAPTADRPPSVSRAARSTVGHAAHAGHGRMPARPPSPGRRPDENRQSAAASPCPALILIAQRTCKRASPALRQAGHGRQAARSVSRQTVRPAATAHRHRNRPAGAPRH